MRLHRDDFIGIIGDLLGFKQPKKGISWGSNGNIMR